MDAELRHSSTDLAIGTVTSSRLLWSPWLPGEEGREGRREVCCHGHNKNRHAPNRMAWPISLYRMFRSMELRGTTVHRC